LKTFLASDFIDDLTEDNFRKNREKRRKIFWWDFLSFECPHDVA
jgi:hypothetical protein